MTDSTFGILLCECQFSFGENGIVDSGTESFYYREMGSTVVEDCVKVGEGTLKGMALFSNCWITYSYNDLSRLS